MYNVGGNITFHSIVKILFDITLFTRHLKGDFHFNPVFATVDFFKMPANIPTYLNNIILDPSIINETTYLLNNSLFSMGNYQGT